MYSPETVSEISIYRQKAIEGTLSLQDMIKAVELMRQGRLTAQSQSKASKKKAPVNTDALLDELAGL